MTVQRWLFWADSISTFVGKAFAWVAKLEKLASPRDLTGEQVIELEKALLATGQSAAAQK